MQKNTQRWNYRDFVRGEHSDPKDLIGHGTHTTSILLNVAQNAHVFVARVFESRKVKVDLCHIVEVSCLFPIIAHCRLMRTSTLTGNILCHGCVEGRHYLHAVRDSSADNRASGHKRRYFPCIF